jgi:phage FluMu protein Com
MLKFNCPACGKKLAVPEEHAGRAGRCPRCKQTVTVPAPAAATPAPPEKQSAQPGTPQGLLTKGAVQQGKKETPRHEPVVADALRTKLAVPPRRVRYGIWIDKRMVIGVCGALILCTGVFTPIISGLSSGSLTYFRDGTISSCILIGLAAASIVFTLIEYYRALWIIGLLSLAEIGYRFVDYEIRVYAKVLGNTHPQWGWLVLALGAFMLMVAAALRE